MEMRLKWRRFMVSCQRSMPQLQLLGEPTFVYVPFLVLILRSPLVGGTFAEPYLRFPVAFNGLFWRRFPYLLPCLLAACSCLGAILIIFLTFNEVSSSRLLLNLKRSPYDFYARHSHPREDPRPPLSKYPAIGYSQEFLGMQVWQSIDLSPNLADDWLWCWSLMLFSSS